MGVVVGWWLLYKNSTANTEPALLQGIPAAHDPDDNRDESEEKQNVDITAQSIGGDDSGEPEQDQGNGDGFKHVRS
jgi:hypothetical protein